MAEVGFAKTFLSSLDPRPVKLSANHVEDPKSFPARPPYILPRMPKPMSKPSKLAPGQERSVTVTLKSLRNPPLDIKLTSQPLDTSVLDIKSKVLAQTRIPVAKMKLLHNKKPVPDSKVLKDLLGDTDMAIDFSVMVIGGAAAIPPEESEAAPTAPATGPAALETEEFWSDLKGFLMQRLKDQAQAEELSTLFKSSWQSSQASP
ncbi:cell-cycle control medial ring component-domain-containing protein [Ilyonectria robusta]|uniref:cell-cycle control medial ring component-domain-containing protein n=1 Tax=Ilyonectria robusta TaxID=1079257 RepID=UPI001E8CB779|nr:cell-cycle control medial ring component-domain-containing protein [Ilyonectria robusta]KAH8706646.1 cell-cycle control medial ring component-domain-containing protein [Ilyonectria robusta]